jgi:hypothetical protein
MSEVVGLHDLARTVWRPRRDSHNTPNVAQGAAFYVPSLLEAQALVNLLRPLSAT